jgi:pyroglutamyl-peptidase
MTAQTEKIILLTGFEPFADHAVNPSQQIVQELDGQRIGDFKIKGLVLPVVFGEAGDSLIQTIEALNPTWVIALGLAADRNGISVERLAVNLDDASIPDNQGKQPVDQEINAGGETVYWSTLPVKKLVSALNGNGFAASLSMSAGTFVCNHVFYRLMVCLKDRPEIKGGFVHLPEDADGYSELRDGIRLLLKILSSKP